MSGRFRPLAKRRRYSVVLATAINKGERVLNALIRAKRLFSDADNATVPTIRRFLVRSSRLA